MGEADKKQPSPCRLSKAQQLDIKKRSHNGHKKVNTRSLLPRRPPGHGKGKYQKRLKRLGVEGLLYRRGQIGRKKVAVLKTRRETRDEGQRC